MSTPVRPLAAPVRRLGRDEPLDQWFDEQIRPLMLAQLDQVRQHTDHAGILAAVRHWLTELGHAADWSPETRKVVQVLASELRHLIGDQ